MDAVLPLHLLPTRLTKFVASSAMLSHRKVKRAWLADRILIHEPHQAPRRPGIQEYVFPGEDHLTFDDAQLVPRTPGAYFLLNKPFDVITTTDDPQGRACLSSWLAHLPASVFPVGRLDRETTGALLLTDDGDLAYMALHPDFHLQKLYALTISTRREPVEEGLRMLEHGVDIKDGKGLARPVTLREVSRGDGHVVVHLTLAEGRNRQIRKMCKAAGLYLDHLHRVSFGPLHVTGMELGACRELDVDEVEMLWQACGGRALVWRRSIRALVDNVKRYRQEGRPHTRLEHWLAKHDDWVREASE